MCVGGCVGVREMCGCVFGCVRMCVNMCVCCLGVHVCVCACACRNMCGGMEEMHAEIADISVVIYQQNY